MIKEQRKVKVKEDVSPTMKEMANHGHSDPASSVGEIYFIYMGTNTEPTPTTMPWRQRAR